MDPLEFVLFDWEMFALWNFVMKTSFLLGNEVFLIVVFHGTSCSGTTSPQLTLPFQNTVPKQILPLGMLSQVGNTANESGPEVADVDQHMVILLVEKHRLVFYEPAIFSQRTLHTHIPPSHCVVVSTGLICQGSSLGEHTHRQASAGDSGQWGEEIQLCCVQDTAWRSGRQLGWSLVILSVLVPNILSLDKLKAPPILTLLLTEWDLSCWTPALVYCCT